MARKTMKAEFREILEKIPDDKKVIGKKLIEELSFMDKTLASLKRQIEENKSPDRRGGSNYLPVPDYYNCVPHPG